MKQYIPDEVLLSSRTDRPERIFISYAHAQSEIVDEIFKGLQDRGHEVWFDKQDIAHDDDWREAISRGIESCNGVLAFLSREAVRNGGVCLDELSIAVGVKYGNIHTVLLEREEAVRPPAQLTHRQWLDMSDWQEVKRQGEAVFRPWFNAKLADIIRVVESEESRKFIGQISTIREKLHIGDLAVSKQNWYLTQKYVGRTWLTQEIETWLDDPEGGRLCTVYGGPGVGKSAFAAQYTYRSSRVAASIFFEHGNVHFNTAGALIRELIFQLACRLPLYRNRVYGIVTTDDQLKTWNEQELFNHLVKAPLTSFQINGGHETLCIVVDGLDECTTDEHNSAAELLGKYVKEFPAWLRVLVLSRRESSVTGWLCPDRQIDMVGGEARNLADIRLYFSETLKKQLDAQPHAEELLDKLTERTEGVFLYAYVVSRMILDGKLDIADTQAYPEGLNSAFREWFHRYFPDISAYRRLYRLYLGMIAASPKPIPVEELDAVDVRYDPEEDCYELNAGGGARRRGSVQDRLKPVNSLMQYRTNQFGKRTVAFTHQYIAEWLTQTDEATNESPAGYYFCNPLDALWAMEASWRQKLENGKELSEYEALHLLEFARKAESDRDALQVAKNRELKKALEQIADQYDNEYQYAAVLQFRICNAERCRFIKESTGDVEDEKEYLTSLDAIAATYHDLGLYKEALALHEQVYEQRKCMLGAEHPDTLSAMNNLAATYSELSRYDKALALQEQAYEQCKHILGAEHPDTLRAMNNLAYTYGKLGHLEEALALHEQVFRLRKRIQGAEHPDTLTAMENLSVTYCKLSRFDEALTLAKRMYELRRRISGSQHADTLSGMANLAEIYRECGQRKEALSLAKQVYELYERTLGADYPETLRAMHNLAVTYYAIGCPEKALSLLKKAYIMRKRILGDVHPDTLLSMYNIVLLYINLHRWNDALPLERQMYTILMHNSGIEYPNILTTMNNFTLLSEALAFPFAVLGRFDEAFSLMEHTYLIRCRILGAEHNLTQEARKLMEEYRRRLSAGE